MGVHCCPLVVIPVTAAALALGVLERRGKVGLTPRWCKGPHVCVVRSLQRLQPFKYTALGNTPV